MQTAAEYIELGFSLGIGSRILKEDANGQAIQKMIKEVPLTALLVENDAPYLRPNIDHLPSSKS